MTSKRNEGQGIRARKILFGIAVALSGAACGGETDEQGQTEVNLRVSGTVCGAPVDYTAPSDARLMALLTPSGRLIALAFVDGPLIRVRDRDQLSAYAREHDIFGVLQLEDPAELRTGSLGAISEGFLLAKGFGSLKISEMDAPELRIDEYTSKGRISGSVTAPIQTFRTTYPEQATEEPCREGDVTIEFDGAFVTWDGQEDCFSPTRNVDRVRTEVLAGCACNPEVDESVCVSSGDAGMAMFCIQEQWSWGYDGPCRALAP